MTRPDPRTARRPVVVTRTYRATPEELWALWTTRDGFESWWGPQGFRADVHAIDAREGGTLHYDMAADTPEMVRLMAEMGRPASHPARARFAEFRPHARLVLASMIDFLPGVTPYESTIAVDLVPLGEHVRMVVTIAPMHDEEFTRMSAEGFGSQLTKLDARFAQAPDDPSIPRPAPPPAAMRRLDPLVGAWDLTGRTREATGDDITGDTVAAWILGGHYLELRGRMTFQGSTFHSLEIIGYDEASDTFPATVYGDMGGVPMAYHWDVRGDEVAHWTEGSRYTGRFGDGGRTLAGAWRATDGDAEAAGANYEAVMTRRG
jgi:uncharacterized protein YndB with AHSA1/START domain